ncbi:hypothetical protein C3747_87g19 [Trypanosoma cruzi]|uniref:Uncharacterized protein n=1 Tax=Trypanosoma cruzi TaxID=5693 RepID=A0A2V2WLK1_TRYCR|nr:hypothetical protein C3747_87g19 [Trypanosoma cruzi]
MDLACPAPTKNAFSLALLPMSILQVPFMALDHRYRGLRGYDSEREERYGALSLMCGWDGAGVPYFLGSGVEWRGLQPRPWRANWPGMVPWFPTFIAGTADSGAMLNLFAVGRRGVEQNATPNVFCLLFEHRGGAATRPASDASALRSAVGAAVSGSMRRVELSADREADVRFDFLWVLATLNSLAPMLGGHGSMSLQYLPRAPFVCSLAGNWCTRTSRT